LTLYQERNKAILEILLSNNVDTVLDCGCGNGRLLNLLFKSYKFKKLSGLDNSKKQIRMARKKNMDSNINFFCQSIFDFAFSSDLSYYDAIVASEIIEHFTKDELNDFLRIVFSILSPKIVIITTPNKDYNYNYEKLYNGLRHSTHYFELNESEAINFAENIEKKYLNYTATCDFCDINHSSHLITFKRSVIL